MALCVIVRYIAVSVEERNTRSNHWTYYYIDATLFCTSMHMIPDACNIAVLLTNWGNGVSWRNSPTPSWHQPRLEATALTSVVGHAFPFVLYPTKSCLYITYRRHYFGAQFCIVVLHQLNITPSTLLLYTVCKIKNISLCRVESAVKEGVVRYMLSLKTKHLSPLHLHASGSWYAEQFLI